MQQFPCRRPKIIGYDDALASAFALGSGFPHESLNVVSKNQCVIQKYLQCCSAIQDPPGTCVLVPILWKRPNRTRDPSIQHPQPARTLQSRVADRRMRSILCLRIQRHFSVPTAKTTPSQTCGKTTECVALPAVRFSKLC